MRKQALYDYISDYFRREMPEAKPELHFNDTFQLLVAVMLSAQCTDKRINDVTPALFRAFPDARSLASATQDEVYAYIKSVSYPNNKARHLTEMAKVLCEVYGGEVPGDMEKLTGLPGVGRKTANVVLSVAFGKSAMAVDTHVFRVSHRIGLVPDSCKTPLSVERMLVRYLRTEDVPSAHHWLILHGRYVCTARKPKCKVCGLKEVCRFHKAVEVKSLPAQNIGGSQKTEA